MAYERCAAKKECETRAGAPLSSAFSFTLVSFAHNSHTRKTRASPLSLSSPPPRHTQPTPAHPRLPRPWQSRNCDDSERASVRTTPLQHMPPPVAPAPDARGDGAPSKATSHAAAALLLPPPVPCQVAPPTPRALHASTSDEAEAGG